jgi:SNF2 family DNA or RNA helicase
MAQLEADLLNGTPIFVLNNADPKFGRAHGSTFDKSRNVWIYPAYPPFGPLVLDDLKKLDPQLGLSPSAEVQRSHLEKLPQLLKDRTLPENFQFVTKPYDHQIDGLMHLYHYPRFGLLWDPGCGKTHPMINLLRVLKGQRALVFGPRVIVMNWVDQIRLHAGKELRVATLTGTPTQKHKVIANYQDFDVLVSSYGTARTMAFPRLCRNAIKAITDASSTGNFSVNSLKEIARVARMIGDADTQMDFVASFCLGMPLTHIERYAKAEAAKKPQFLCDVDYSIIVADESQCIKEPSSQQTKAMIGLSKKAARRYIMSGTPALGDPRHLYSQMQFLSPAIIPENWFEFLDKFVVRSPYNKHIVTGFKNLNILNQRVQRVAIRKRKDECLDLPPRTMIDIPVEMSPEQKTLYNTLIQAMSVDLGSFFSNPSGTKIAVQNAAILVSKLAQVTSGFLLDNQKKTGVCDECPHLSRCVENNIRPYSKKCLVYPVEPETKVNFLKENPKIEALDELLDAILENPENKVIIWGVFTAELDLIEKALKQRKVGYVRVDGSTSNRIQTHVDYFNTDKDCRVYLGQEATGVGITINSATYMIYFSFDFSLDHYLQSIDRNYRAGQTKKTTVYRLISKDGIDEYKATALDQKLDISRVLTNKIACVTCPKRFDCLKEKIELFDPKCLYKPGSGGTVRKSTTKVSAINETDPGKK